MLPNKVSTARDTPSPEPLAKRGDSIYLFIHSFIHVCLPESPKRSPPTCTHTRARTHRKNIKAPSTEPHADGRPTYNRVRPRSPRGSLTTLLSLPQYHADFRLGLGRQEPCYSVCRSNPHQGIPFTTVTASHVTQGRVEYESTLPRDMDGVLVLWQASRQGDLGIRRLAFVGVLAKKMLRLKHFKHIYIVAKKITTTTQYFVSCKSIESQFCNF